MQASQGKKIANLQSLPAKTKYLKIWSSLFISMQFQSESWSGCPQ